jgi:integrase
VLVNFLAYSGLRFGEAAALRVESFDFLRRRLNVTEAVAEVRGASVTRNPQESRTPAVPFPGFLAEELATLMIGKSMDALVFTSQTGLQLWADQTSSQTIWTQWRHVWRRVREVWAGCARATQRGHPDNRPDGL